MSTMTPTSIDFEDPEDAALRERHGLRPVWYAHDCKEPHPDTHPGPPWCWPANSPQSVTHEVPADHVAAAPHAPEPARATPPWLTAAAPSFRTPLAASAAGRAPPPAPNASRTRGTR